MDSKSIRIAICCAVLAGPAFWLSKRHAPVKISTRPVIILSVSGKPLAGIFDHVAPDPRIAELARQKRQARLPECRNSTGLLARSSQTLARIGDLLGLTPQTVKAQSYCVNCYIAMGYYTCPGGLPCSELIVQEGMSGGAQNMGETITDPLGCGEADNCAPLAEFGSCTNPYCGS